MQQKLNRFANAILVVWALCFGLVLIYAVTNLAKYVGYSGYLICAGLGFGLFFSIASLRLRAETKFSLVIFILSIAIPIYGFELALPIFEWWKAPASNFERANEVGSPEVRENFDRRTKLEVVRDLRQAGENAYPSYHPGGIVISGLPKEFVLEGKPVLPLSGLPNVRLVFCNESGKYLIYDSDELGFHNPKGIFKSGRLDIAAIGDSFVHGACVPSEKNAISLIRNRFPQTANFGMYGNGPLSELAILREYAASFRPKVVLWFYFENDIAELVGFEKKNEFIQQYLNRSFSQGLLAKQDKVNSLVRAYLDRELQMRAKPPAAGEATAQMQSSSKKNDRDELPSIQNNLVRGAFDILMLRSLRRKLNFTFDKDLEMFKDILTLARDEVQGWGGELIFVYLPDFERFNRPNVEFIYRDPILSVASGLNLQVIDLYPVLAAHPDPLSLFPFRVWNHYNEEGYALVADSVNKVLLQRPDLQVSKTQGQAR